jgi:hypothetical protein
VSPNRLPAITRICQYQNAFKTVVGCDYQGNVNITHGFVTPNSAPGTLSQKYWTIHHRISLVTIPEPGVTQQPDSPGHITVHGSRFRTAGPVTA